MSSSIRSSATPRLGIALPIALAAIIAVGALIAGVFFASTQEYRVGRNTLTAQRALHGAEVGLSSVVSQWKWTDSLKVGRTKKLQDTVIDEAVVKRQITKVSPTMFWVTSTARFGGQSLQGAAVKRLNTLIHIETPDFKIMGAITARGTNTVSGDAKVNGNDSIPAGWDCPPSGAPAAGLVVGDSLLTTSSSGNCSSIAGASDYTCVTGSPKVKDSTALVNDAATYTNFGGFSYDSLTLLADKTVAGGSTVDQIKPSVTALATCNTPDAKNWGDTLATPPSTHRGVCQNYYPIVWVKGAGTTTINNIGGQGILLVDGNLVLAGRFQWTGLVLVKGSVSIAGNPVGAKVTGAIMAMNSGGGTNSISGQGKLQFSRCAIATIMAKRSTAATARYRPWADLSF
jgi:hypothetical protein